MLSLSDVTAVIVTRGDVDLDPIFDSLIFPKVVVWDNQKADDLKAFGRYAALQFGGVETEIVYTQDDDCLISPDTQHFLVEHFYDGGIVSNMPVDHNIGHPLLNLLGWGSVWNAYAPFVAFNKWIAAGHPIDTEDFLVVGADIVFPVLTQGIRYDLGHEERPFSHDATRTHNQHGYAERKQWYYETAADLLGDTE